MPAHDPHQIPMRARRIGIDTQHEATLYLRRDSPVCIAEGFSALSRVSISRNGHRLIATLHMVDPHWLKPGEVGLSESAWLALGVAAGEPVWLSHPEHVTSFTAILDKIEGQPLRADQLKQIIGDILTGHYSNMQIAAFLTACSSRGMNLDETTSLTRAMLASGQCLNWGKPCVIDKHCVGGLPGNRTTPILVAILAACGLTMPKTSSRAITSPAGTADTMEVLTEVSLALNQLQAVVGKHGGCLAWGGAMQLSPADDRLIQVERALNLDSSGQLIASVLSKKLAAGATHVLIDIPYGPTAKVNSRPAAQALAEMFKLVGQRLGLQVFTLLSDGRQPIGNGIGPALEARDVVAVLQNKPEAPADLRHKSLQLAAAMLEMVAQCPPGEGLAHACKVLDSGQAWAKFKAICIAQGGLKTPPQAAYHFTLCSKSVGTVSGFDNLRLAQLAKLAGAPADPAAGIELHCHLGDPVAEKQPLLTLHAQSAGALNYAVGYLEAQPDMIKLEELA